MTHDLMAFIEVERSRFSTRDNNRFANSFAQILRYYEFLEIIVTRYEAAARECGANLKELTSTYKPGTHRMTRRQVCFSERNRELTRLVHLEIESFYLFAKILLDKTAVAFQVYFGPERGVHLRSHDRLAKKIQTYAERKRLAPVEERLRNLIRHLKRDIVDYRDKSIVHEESPRVVRGTSYTADYQSARMSISRLYPTEHDSQVESEPLGDVLSRIKAYVAEMLEYISANRESSALELEAEASDSSSDGCPH